MNSQKAKPAEGIGGHRGIEIENFKRFEKNTLKGFFTVILPSCLIIHNLTLHQKGDARWIGLPGRKYTGADGIEGYAPIVELATRAAADRFRDAVLAAIDAAGVLE